MRLPQVKIGATSSQAVLRGSACAQVDDDTAALDALMMSSSPEEPATGSTDKRLRTVFLIDDDPLLVEALGELLREEGYEVEAFTDGQAALARLSTGVRPHVVLLDYVMPIMNGEQFLQALAASGIQLRVVIFTAMSGWRVPHQHAACTVLRKPIELDELLAAIS